MYTCVFVQGTNLIQMKITMPSDKSGTQSPSLAFLLLERYNGIRLVQSIHASLAALSKVIRGTQLLTTEVQKLAGALLEQEVFIIKLLLLHSNLLGHTALSSSESHSPRQSPLFCFLPGLDGIPTASSSALPLWQCLASERVVGWRVFKNVVRDLGSCPTWMLTHMGSLGAHHHAKHC